MSTQKHYTYTIVLFGSLILLLFTLQTKFVFNQDIHFNHYFIPLVLITVFSALMSRLKTIHKRLERLTGTDPLTGLSNRRALKKNLIMCIENHKRYGTKFSVLILDIDNFKNINDTFGHQKGDNILVTISNILKNTSRTTDCCARWGGEEFIILLPNSDVNGAIIKAENLRSTIENTISNPAKVTCSFGVSDAYKEDDTIDNIIMRADQALYQAKYMGKNRVECLKAA